MNSDNKVIVNKADQDLFLNKVKVMFSPSHLMNILTVIMRTIILLGISYYILYPLIVKVSLTFMSKGDIYDTSVMLVPKNFTFDNLEIVWKFMKYPSSFMKSTILAVTITILQLGSCTMVGYGFARFDFKGKKFLFALVMFTLLVPPQTYIIPLYLQYRFFDVFGIVTLLTGNKGINLLDSYWPYIVNGITSMGLKNGLYIYMFRQFFRNMPKELEEASLIDGAGVLRTFLYVMLPSATPILVTVGLFSFVWQWNDYFYMSWFTPTMQSLPRMLELLISNYQSYLVSLNPLAESVDPRYAILLNSVGCLLVILPPVIVYIFLQKYFIQSIERSGIVG